MPQPQIYIHPIWKVTIIPQLVNLFPKLIYRVQNMVIFSLCYRCPYLTLPFVLMLRFKSFKDFKTRDFRFKPSFPTNSDFAPMSEAFLCNITNIWLSSNSGRQWTLSSTSTERSIWPLRTRKNVKDQTLKKEKQIYPDDNVLQGKESVLTEAEGNFMSTRRWQPTRTISKRSSMPSRWVFSITTSSKNYQKNMSDSDYVVWVG